MTVQRWMVAFALALLIMTTAGPMRASPLGSDGPGAETPTGSHSGRRASTLAGGDESLELPKGWSARLVYEARLAGLARIVHSELGQVYIGQGDDAGNFTVSLLDTATGDLTPVLEDVASVSSVVIGGPEDTFLIAVENEVWLVRPDGTSTVWGTFAGAMPWYFTADFRLLGIAIADAGDESIVELFSDGTSSTLATGFETAYDVVADGSGNLYVADIGVGELVRVDASGTSSVVVTITPDNTDLGFDSAGNLYINNAEGFARVDLSGGTTTPIVPAAGDCPGGQSPADFVIDAEDRAFFASWVAARITWLDIASGQGDGMFVADDMFENTHAADLGPDGRLYIAVPGCGTARSAQVVRFESDGEGEVFVTGIAGRVTDIATDSTGGVYLATSTEQSSGILYVSGMTGQPVVIPDSTTVEFASLTVDPSSGHLFAVLGVVSDLPETTVMEFDASGLVATFTVSLPKAAQSVDVAAAPNGALFAQVVERERFSTGPEVDRLILELDLAAGTSDIVAQINRVGCCPLTGFSVDHDGDVWWLLNPDFLLYRVSPEGVTTLFARNTPIDAAAVAHTASGELLLVAPSGILRLRDERLYPRRATARRGP
jgi:streptogramin lyase